MNPKSILSLILLISIMFLTSCSASSKCCSKSKDSTQCPYAKSKSTCSKCSSGECNGKTEGCTTCKKNSCGS